MDLILFSVRSFKTIYDQSSFQLIFTFQAMNKKIIVIFEFISTTIFTDSLYFGQVLVDYTNIMTKIRNPL